MQHLHSIDLANQQQQAIDCKLDLLRRRVLQLQNGHVLLRRRRDSMVQFLKSDKMKSVEFKYLTLLSRFDQVGDSSAIVATCVLCEPAHALILAL